jgi:hypothetical protein
MKNFSTLAPAVFALLLPLQAAAAPSSLDIGEGYARPTFPELVQSLVLMNGFDISNAKVADEYGKVVYCDLYEKNYKNDVAWKRVREEIVNRALRKQEYYRVKYEIVSPFKLGRYDFEKQFFPLQPDSTLNSVGYINLFSADAQNENCGGRNIYTSFPQNVNLELNQPLTLTGFSVPADKIKKILARIEEAGSSEKEVYGRIRMIASGAAKGASVSLGSALQQSVLKGRVTSIDFFIDRELTKPIGGIRYAKP